MTSESAQTVLPGENNSPPAVYLCQVGPEVSCGACCGLYNVSDPSRDALRKRLARRAHDFASTPRTETAIEAFRRRIEGWTPEDRPLAQFHHCPFLGLVGRGRSRVGCLLHPEATGNHGRDWRGLSYYGAKACRSYFCPTCRVLPASHLTILRGLGDDWYAYGLIITEHRLLAALFDALEGRLGRPLQPAEAALPSARRRLQDFFNIKPAWPYRRGDEGMCHFPFDNGLYERPAVSWPSAARPAPSYQVVFRELESVFASEDDMRAAVRWLDHCLEELVPCLQTGADDLLAAGGVRSAASA